MEEEKKNKGDVENKKKEDEEKIKTNPTIEEENASVHGHNRHDDKEAKQNKEFEVEDSLARNAFYLTIIFLTIFVCLFIYNIIRCYTRSITNPSERPNQHGYSKDLSHPPNPEDTTLDLSS